MALTSSSRKHLMAASIGLLLAILPLASSQGLPVQYGLLPLGDLTTVDQDGPYFVPEVQSFEIEAALTAKTGAPGAPYTDADVLNFLANTECLEATFNTFAAFGQGLPASLKPGNVTGAMRANLSEEVQSWAEEVALDEQGHVRMIRQVLGERSVPCPALNIAAGFQAYFDTAVRMVSNPPFDPFKNDINFLLSTWSLEEIGATGDKGCILLASNPGVSNCIAGLAGAASYQSGVDRHLLWQRRNETVPEYNMTVHQIVEAISNIRDTWDGPAEVDQPLYNGNPNFIAVPSGNINLVPTDLRGLTFSRTPQQVLRSVTLGSETGKGGFFPEGVNGRINSTAGFNDSANAWGGYPGNNVVVRSLIEVNKTGLLNSNITNVTAAPLEVQAEASGQEYKASDVAATNAPSVTLIGTAATPASGGNAATNTASINGVPEAGVNTAALNGASPAPSNGTDNTTSPSPALGSENVTSPSPEVGTENMTSPEPIVTLDNTTSPSPAAGAENSTSPSPAVGSENATSPSPAVAIPAVIVTPVEGAGNTTSPSPAADNATSPSSATSIENATSPSPAVAIPAVIVAPVEGAGNTTSPSPATGTENATSPSPATGAENATSPSPAVAIPVIVTPVPGADNTTSPSPATETTTSPSPAAEPSASPSPATETSPAPVVGTENATSPSPSPEAAVPVVVTPVPGADNATSPSPATETTTSPSPTVETTTSPSPTVETRTTSPSPTEITASPSPSPSPATGGNAAGDNTTVVVPITTALNQTSTNETALTTTPATFTTTSPATESSPTPSPSPAPVGGNGANSGNTTGDNTTGIIAPISSPAVAVLTTSPTPEATASPSPATGGTNAGTVGTVTAPEGTANTSSPSPANGTAAGNGTTSGAAPSNGLLAVAVGNLTDNQTAAVADAVKNAAESVTNGAADTTVSGGFSPAPGTRKLRFFRLRGL